MNTNVGLFWLVSKLGADSTWVVPAIAVLLYAPLMMLRNKKEGMQYQVAWSADFGCSALLLVGVICCCVLLAKPSLPLWLQGGWSHFLAFIVGFFGGYFWMIVDPPKQKADEYHHMVIFPLMFYLVVVSVPVIVLAGTPLQKLAMWVFLAVFVALFILDCVTGRMDQRPWMRARCQVKFKNEFTTTRG